MLSHSFSEARVSLWVSQAEIKVSAGLCSSMKVWGRIFFEAQPGCWQNPAFWLVCLFYFFCTFRTEVNVSSLAFSRGLLSALRSHKYILPCAYSIFKPTKAYEILCFKSLTFPSVTDLISGGLSLQ